MKNLSKFIIFCLIILSIFLALALPKQTDAVKLVADFESLNNRVIWELVFYLRYSGGSTQSGADQRFWYTWVDTKASNTRFLGSQTVWGVGNYGPPPYGITWSTACVDPKADAAIYYDPVSGTAYYRTGWIDITDRRSSDQNAINALTSDTRVSVIYGTGRAMCPFNCTAPSCSGRCGTVTNSCGASVNCGGCGGDYCSGANTTWECNYVNRFCGGNNYCGSNTTSLSSNCGSKSSCTNPPGNRSDSAFCQGTKGTDRAAGVSMNWGGTSYTSSYDLQLRKVGGGDLHEWNGTASKHDIPGSGCTTGPGGCSLPYNTAYEWRVRSNINTGSWNGQATEWSNWNPRTTNDCSAKPDLRITNFVFPGGNSALTSDARVTIYNDSDKAVSNNFVVRVNNGGGSPDKESATVGGIAARGTREIIVTGVERPTANKSGSPRTATAKVDATNVVDEYNEDNNVETDNYNTTSHVSGVIFVDTNGNGIQDGGESLYTGSVTVRVRDLNDGNVDKDYTTTSGSYTSSEEDKGDYNVRVPSPPPTSMYERTTPASLPVTVNFGGNQTVNFGYKLIISDITMHVYIDLNGNGAKDIDIGESGYSGASLTVTGNGAGTYTTDASGNYVISRLYPGTSVINLVDPPPPTGWAATTPTSRTINVPPTQIVNFGVQPPPPRCSGGVSATPSTVIVPGTSTLRCESPVNPVPSSSLEYRWFPPSVGTVDNINSAVTTYRSPVSTNETQATVGMQICYLGTNNCSSSGTTITLISQFSVSGNVFLDLNGDGIKNGGESNFTNSPITVSSSHPGTTITYPSPGAYRIYGLLEQNNPIIISYTNLPPTYYMTYPLNGPPPSFSVNIGRSSCTDPNGAYGGECSDGDLVNLNFAITDAIPWIQSGGSDVWLNSGINNPIPPSATCGPVMSNNGVAGTPGVMFSGTGSYTFGLGQASPNPYNWIVGGLTYPENYTPATPGKIKTSYNYINSLVTQNNIPIIDIATVPGCGNLAACNLPANLANGVYIANGNLTLTDASGTFVSGRDYVILIDGNFNINTSIDVPVGATVLFTADEDIHVGANVGTSTQSSTVASIEGWFSADRSFYADGVNACPAPDLRLNVEGAIVVNASFQGGSFVNNRDLCAGNRNCPVFYVKERPDFVLNAPLFIMSPRRIWQEIAP